MCALSPAHTLPYTCPHTLAIRPCPHTTTVQVFVRESFTCFTIATVQVFVRESAILIVEDIIYLLSEKNENVLAADGSAIAPVPIEASAPHASKSMHIMISYSWAVAKHFVVEVLPH